MRGASVHVFVGPSCPTSIIETILPNAVIRPPIRHGDLFSTSWRSTDVILMIDGNYHQKLAVRHKEILEVMAHGVTVIGAASIGALRAAELAPFGMLGVGKVFEWYRDEIVTQDDAVAVAHEEHASPDSVNIPLVNLYAALREAVEAEVVGEDQVQDLVASLAAEYYPQRSLSRVLAILDQDRPVLGRWYRERLKSDSHAFDQKRRDCLEALEVVAAQVFRGRTGAAMEDSWRTVHVRRWRNRFGVDAEDGLPAATRLAYQQIFDPEFPEIWWKYLTTCHPDPDAGFEAFLARELGADSVGWSGDADRRKWITDLLGPTPDLAADGERSVLLSRETAADRDQIRRYVEHGRQYLRSHPQRGARFISSEGCQGLLARLWRVDGDLSEHCHSRGLRTAQEAVDALKPFVIGLLHEVRGEAWEGGQADA